MTVPMVAPEPSTALDQCVAVFKKWLFLPDPGALFATLGAVAANRREGDPVWLLVVGPPGSGKTEVLNPVAALPDVWPAATLTEAALLSGTPKRDVANGAKGGLLRQIGDFGIICAKDFGSVLSMHRDTRSTLLAALREVYDGSWTRHLGTDGGRTLTWTGKVGFIAGCTPAIDSHHAVMGSMGERFVLFRLPPVDGAAQTRRALARGNADGRMRDELGAAVRTVLDAADDHEPLPLTDDETDRLVAICELAVRCRSSVERDGHTREIELVPEPEAPARIALVLRRLLDGMLAVGVDRPQAWTLVAKMALDSMPAIRRTAFEELLRREHETGTKDLAQALDYPTTTTRRALEDLAAHGVASRSIGSGPKGDLWQATAWARERWAYFVPETSPQVRSVPETSHRENSLITPLRVKEDISGTQTDDLGAWTSDTPDGAVFIDEIPLPRSKHSRPTNSQRKYGKPSKP